MVDRSTNTPVLRVGDQLLMALSPAKSSRLVVMNFLHASYGFVKSHLNLICTVVLTFAGIVAAATQWWLNVQTIRKLRIELKKIQQDLNKGNPTIPIATLDEIIKYSQTKPPLHELKRYLKFKLQQPEPIEVDSSNMSRDQAESYSSALAAILPEKFSFSDSMDTIYWVVNAFTMAIIILQTVPLLEWNWGTKLIIIVSTFLAINAYIQRYLQR